MSTWPACAPRPRSSRSPITAPCAPEGIGDGGAAWFHRYGRPARPESGHGLADALVRNAFALAGRLDVPGREQDLALSGWPAGRWSRDGSRLDRLQMSSLHYFQRPDIDYAHVDPTPLRCRLAGVCISTNSRGTSSSTPLWARCRRASRPTTSAITPRRRHQRARRAGLPDVPPGPVFAAVRAPCITGTTIRGIRSDEYIYLDGEGQFLNYWTADLHLITAPKLSHC